MKKKIVNRIGITPAYAGNTYTEDENALHLGNHPRLRGEHNATWENKVHVRGSPPPTRGTPFFSIVFW